jgi:thioredoxin-like negative regulator of GroEL
LYYGNTGAGGMKTTEYIQEVQSAADLEGFLASCAPEQDVAGLVAPVSVPCEKQLAVVDVSIEKNAPVGCMHIFPAIISLAKNTAGATRWARLIGDANEESAALMKSMNVTEVPTFVFYADGKEVDRYSGSDRMALMNKVLQFQRANGVKLPERATRKRMSTAEAKEIARAAREREKAAGRRSGW